MKRKQDEVDVKQLLYAKKFVRKPHVEYKRGKNSEMYIRNCNSLNRMKNKLRDESEMHLQKPAMTAHVELQINGLYGSINSLEANNKNLKWGFSTDMFLVKKKISECLRSFDEQGN